MSNSIAPGSSADVNVRVTALTTNPNVPVTYKTIILKKNLVDGVNTLTQEMMSDQNTKYVIKYDYTLDDAIVIPENCILEFDGGSISGDDRLTFQNTLIDGKPIIKTEDVYGNIKNSILDISWFDLSDYSNVITELSKSADRIYINKNIVCKSGVELYCNTFGKGVISFVKDGFIQYAVTAIGEFDIDEINIDCSGVSVCSCGFLHDKTYYTSRKIHHNVNVKNVFNKTDSNYAANGITYSHHTGDNYSAFNIVLTCKVENVCGCPNGTTGDTPGSVGCVLIGLLNTNSLGGQFVIRDSYIKNAYYENGSREDAVAIHIINNYPESNVILTNSFIGFGATRSVKLQGSNITMSNCTIDIDSDYNIEEIYDAAYRGIDCMSQNTIISDCIIKSKKQTNPGQTGGGLVLTNYGDVIVRGTKINLENGYNHIIVIDNAKCDLDVNVLSNAIINDVYSAIYITSSSGKVKIKAHGNIPNLEFVHKSGYVGAEVSLSGTCLYGFRTRANWNSYDLTIHNSDLICTECVVFNGNMVSLKGIRVINSRFQSKRFVLSSNGTWTDSLFDNNVFICNSDESGLVALFLCSSVKFTNNIIDGNGHNITLIKGNGEHTFINNVFKTPLVGNVIDALYCEYNFINNVFYIEEGAGFNINMANVFAFGNIDINKKAMLFADALGNAVGTVYPKVIGTPTAGNLAKFNSTDSHDIEDSGQAPAI